MLITIHPLQKDDTIRELTDRLFFGADRFKAYVNEKTTSSRSNQQTATDNYYTTAGQPKYPTPRSQLRYGHNVGILEHHFFKH